MTAADVEVFTDLQRLAQTAAVFRRGLARRRTREAVEAQPTKDAS